MWSILLLLTTFSAHASDLLGLSVFNPDLDPDWTPTDSETCEVIEAPDELLEYLEELVSANEALVEMCDTLTEDDEVCVAPLDAMAAIEEAAAEDNEDAVVGFTFDAVSGGTASLWESCTAGAPTAPVDESYPKSGLKYIDTLTLRGPLTATREALCDSGFLFLKEGHRVS